MITKKHKIRMPVAFLTAFVLLNVLPTFALSADGDLSKDPQAAHAEIEEVGARHQVGQGVQGVGAL